MDDLSTFKDIVVPCAALFGAVVSVINLILYRRSQKTSVRLELQSTLLTQKNGEITSTQDLRHATMITVFLRVKNHSHFPVAVSEVGFYSGKWPFIKSRKVVKSKLGTVPARDEEEFAFFVFRLSDCGDPDDPPDEVTWYRVLSKCHGVYIVTADDHCFRGAKDGLRKLQTCVDEFCITANANKL